MFNYVYPHVLLCLCFIVFYRVSGDMTYKKNVGRLNRHEPKQTNREENKSKIDFDVESLNSSKFFDNLEQYNCS